MSLAPSTVTASIFVSNTAAASAGYTAGEADCAYNSNGTDGYGVGSPASSGGFNVGGEYCPLAAGLSSDTFNWSASSVLSPLANNGGPTATEALISGSPAIDRVPIGSLSPSGASICPANGSVTGQGGISRPVGPACDAGALEAYAPNSIKWTSLPFGSTVAVGRVFTVAATATSGDPVTFSVVAAPPGVCSISGAIITFAHSGDCDVFANQAGGNGYAAAPQVERTIVVDPAPQKVVFTSTPPKNPSPGGQTYAVAGHGGGSGNSLTFSIESQSSSVCTISGSKVSFIGAGMCTIYAFEAGNADYQNGSATQSIPVGFFVNDAVLSPATRGFAYTPYTLSTGGGKCPCTWTHSALPAGLNMSSGGIISGTPTYANALGLHSFTVTATDSTTPTHRVATKQVIIDFVKGIFISDVNLGKIVEVGVDGTQRTIATGLHSPNGLAVDPAGDVYVSEAGLNRVDKITPAGVKTAAVSGLNAPSRLALDAAGDLYVADTNNNRVVELPAAGGSIKVIASALSAPVGVAVDASNNVFVTESGSETLLEISPSGTQSTVVSDVFVSPNGLGIEPNGDIYVADWGDSVVTQIKASSSGYIYTGGFGLTGLNHPNDIAVDRTNQKIYVADHDADLVLEFQLNGQGIPVQSTVPTSGLSGPNSVAVG